MMKKYKFKPNEKKVEEIKNRPCLLLYKEEGGLLDEKAVSTRETFQVNYKLFKQISQRGERWNLKRNY